LPEKNISLWSCLVSEFDQLLILSKRYSVDSQLLYNAAINRGLSVWRFNSQSMPHELTKNQQVAVYAESSIAEYVAQELALSLLSPKESLLAELPYSYVKRQISYVPFKDFKRPKEKMFIKPADYKYFIAGVYEANDNIAGFNQCQPHDPILLSEVVEFVEEYRFFVLNGKRVAVSDYVINSKYTGDNDSSAKLSPKLLSFADDVITSINNLMPITYVIDIGRFITGEYAVIEFNPTWGSGLYKASADKVLECVVAACQPK
jgi:hypothetical protein